MKALKLLALAATMTFALAALADVEEKMEMKIVVAGAASDESATIHWIGSGDAGFDMQGMQVGETQSIVDESGRAVLVTRETDGFRFDVDGETIVVPDMGAHEEYLTLTDGSDMTADFDVEIVGDHYAMPTFGDSGVTIISGEPLDASTQESIKAVLQSAGRDDQVTFVDGSGGTDYRQIKMIRKRVEVTQ
jgi:hypothetical protein